MKKLILAFTAFLAMSTSAFAELGSLSSDLVFTPVTPCRILDTRNAGSKSGILQANTVRGFWGWNNTFAPQGGSATGCGTLESTNTAAVLVNFTVATPVTGGYITAYPGNVADVDKPLAATVNFTAGSVIGNNATVKLNQTNTGDDFKIYSTSNVHVVADIVGYYSKPVATALECVNTATKSTLIYANSPLVVGANFCAAGYMTTSAHCETNEPGVYLSGSGMNGNNPLAGAFCRFFNSTGSQQITYTSSTCCRIPGR
jgi:ribosomal protein S8E